MGLRSLMSAQELRGNSIQAMRDKGIERLDCGMANAPMGIVPPSVSAAFAQEQHGDDAQRDEQADGGPVVEQLRRPR